MDILPTPAFANEITEEWITCVLNDYERRKKSGLTVAVTQLQTKPAVAPGENFGSQLVQMVVDTRVSKDGSHTLLKTYTLIIKLLFGGNFFRRLSREMFDVQEPGKEVLMYGQVLPEIIEFGKEIIPTFGTLEIPEYIYGRGAENKNEFVVVMDDERCNGFSVTNKFDGLNVGQVKAALEAMAKLHALSYAYNAKQNIPKKYPQVVLTDFFRGSFAGFCMMTIEFMIQYMKDIGKSEHATVLDTNKHIIAEKIRKFSIYDDNDMTCLVHGDFWSNNILFHESNSNHVKLLDWSLSLWNTPLQDLQYFIYSSTKRETREKHWDEVFQHYHSTFTALTEALGAPAANWDHETFKRKMKETRFYGVMHGCLVYMMAYGSKGKEMGEERDSSAPSSSAGWMWPVTGMLGGMVGRVLKHWSLSWVRFYGMRRQFQPFFDEILRSKDTEQYKRMSELIDEAIEHDVFDIFN